MSTAAEVLAKPVDGRFLTEKQLANLPLAVRTQVMADQRAAAEQMGVALPDVAPNAPDTGTSLPGETGVGGGAEGGVPPAAPAPSDPPPPPPPPPGGTGEDWEQRFRTIEGKYRAEVPRLTEALAAQREDNQALRGQLDTLNAQMQQLQQQLQQQPRPVDELPPLTAEEEQQLGEMPSYVRRMAQQLIQKATAPLVSQITDLQAKLTHDIKVVDQRTLHLAMDRACPEWRELNNDVGFLAWVRGTEPVSGLRFLDILQRAYSSNDFERVLAVFNGYKATRPPAVQPPAPPAQPVSPNGGNGGTPNGAPRTGLEALVMPNGGRGGASTPPAGTPSAPEPVRRSAIRAHEQAVARGVYAGKPAEFNRVQAAIDAAYANNLIIED